VLIFEDADGDGRHEQATVFFDDVQHLTSVEVGLGGVWLMAPPQLLFVPTRIAMTSRTVPRSGSRWLSISGEKLS
jgi:hypothetical protein